MWTCHNCDRIFQKANQPHSCRKVSPESHFENKEKAREIFDYLHRQIEQKIGKCTIVSLPCCIHLFGNYDFLAVLPKKDRIEIRFALHRTVVTSRLKVSVPMSAKVFKNCLDIGSREEIDNELLGWLDESYYLKLLL